MKLLDYIQLQTRPQERFVNQSAETVEIKGSARLQNCQEPTVTVADGENLHCPLFWENHRREYTMVGKNLSLLYLLRWPVENHYHLDLILFLSPFKPRECKSVFFVCETNYY